MPIAIVTLLEADDVTGANAGLANGLWFSAAQVGGVSGPLMLGIVADSAFGYAGALTTVMIVGTLGIALALVQRRVYLRTNGSAQRSPC